MTTKESPLSQFSIPNTMHPLNSFAKNVEKFGYRLQSLRRMKRMTQSLSTVALLWILISSTTGFAPTPYRVYEGRYFIYLDPKDPNSLSLINSDPETYRLESKIDLSKVPDIL